MTQLRDEVRGPFTHIASAARTATFTGEWTAIKNARAIIVHIDCTAITATPSVVFSVQGKDHVGEAYTILDSAAIAGTGKDTLYVYPGAPATAEESAPAVLPPFIRVLATHADSDSITYSVGLTLLP